MVTRKRRWDPHLLQHIEVEVDRDGTSHQSSPRATTGCFPKDPAPSAPPSTATSPTRMDMLTASLAATTRSGQEMVDLVRQLGVEVDNTKRCLGEMPSIGDQIRALTFYAPLMQAILTRIS